MAYNKETGMYEGFIYKIINKVNEHFYIGQTRTTIEERYDKHTQKSTINRYQNYGLYKAFRKYGVDNFYVIELESYEYKELEELEKKLNEREHFLVVEAKKKYGKEFVYNHSDGGDYDGCATERVPIIQYDLNCVEIGRFDSIIDAKRNTGASDISEVINKKPQKLSSHGYIWRRQDDPLTDEEKRSLRVHFDTMPIKQYCIGDKPLHIFKNSVEAANYINELFFNNKNNISILKGNIRQCCNRSVKTSYGFVWRYEFDSVENDNINYKDSVLSIEQRENGTGKLLNTFISTGEAERITGVDDSIISQCCNHNLSSAGGYLWNRVGDYDPDILRTITVKPVVQLSKQDEYIATYDSPTCAESVTGIYSKSISRACRGFLKSTGGYHWQYLYDYLKILP